MSMNGMTQQTFSFMAGLQPPPASPPVDWNVEVEVAAARCHGLIPLSLVAKYLGVTGQTVRNWIVDGTQPTGENNVKLEATQMGRNWVVHINHLRTFEAAR
ncbi:MAG TPA: hypothetical protein VD995_32555 [Azospirillum sp.]|nr:hypothetical protein [Azospirillum sp.]